MTLPVAGVGVTAVKVSSAAGAPKGNSAARLTINRGALLHLEAEETKEANNEFLMGWRAEADPQTEVVPVRWTADRVK